jgi:diacylglycerol kinase (ATP)
MRATLIHNPSAGNGGVSAAELLGWLRATGASVGYRSTEAGDAGEALREPVDLVVVGGGDGTVAKVALALPDRSVPLAILPLGTANNIATSLGIAGPPAVIIAGLATARPRRLGLGLAHGPWGSRPFIEGVGQGCLARSMAEMAARRVEGDRLRAGRDHLRSILAAAPPSAVRLRLDGRVLEVEALFLEISSIPLAGPRLPLAAGADPGDGLLDLVWAGPDRRRELLDWLAAPAAAAAPVELRRGSEIRFGWGDGTPLHIDDEFPQSEAGEGRIELQAVPVSVLVPEATP